jgi:hypothetical protein
MFEGAKSSTIVEMSMPFVAETDVSGVREGTLDAD